jgi:hypothetical protein
MVEFATCEMQVAHLSDDTYTCMSRHKYIQQAWPSKAMAHVKTHHMKQHAQPQINPFVHNIKHHASTYLGTRGYNFNQPMSNIHLTTTGTLEFLAT